MSCFDNHLGYSFQCLLVFRTTCDDVDSVRVFVFIDDLPKEINVYCGNKRPPMLMSSDTRMELAFSSRNVATTRGFMANYSFVTGK
jgi:CUB domain